MSAIAYEETVTINVTMNVSVSALIDPNNVEASTETFLKLTKHQIIDRLKELEEVIASCS